MSEPRALEYRTSGAAEPKPAIDPKRLRRRKQAAWFFSGFFGCLITVGVVWGIYHRYFDMTNTENPNSPYHYRKYPPQPKVIYAEPGHNWH